MTYDQRQAAHAARREAAAAAYEALATPAGMLSCFPVDRRRRDLFTAKERRRIRKRLRRRLRRVEAGHDVRHLTRDERFFRLWEENHR
jgi:hypothetical protein